MISSLCIDQNHRLRRNPRPIPHHLLHSLSRQAHRRNRIKPLGLFDDCIHIRHLLLLEAVPPCVSYVWVEALDISICPLLKDLSLSRGQRAKTGCQRAGNGFEAAGDEGQAAGWISGGCLILNERKTYMLLTSTPVSFVSWSFKIAAEIQGLSVPFLIICLT